MVVVERDHRGTMSVSPTSWVVAHAKCQESDRGGHQLFTCDMYDATPGGRKTRGRVPVLLLALHGDVRQCEVSPLLTGAVWKCPIPPAMIVSSGEDG